jgi:hypothetical protein
MSGSFAIFSAASVLIDLGFEAIRQPWRCAFVRHVASRAGHSSASAIAAMRAVPRPSAMVFTNPSGIRA